MEVRRNFIALETLTNIRITTFVAGGHEVGSWAKQLEPTERQDAGRDVCQASPHKGSLMSKTKTRLSKARFEAMVEDATVDCYNPSEQATGWFTMIDEHLKVPFQTQLLGLPVTVEKVDLNQNEDIVAICRRGKHRQTVPVLDLPLSAPLPAGAEWLEAYRRWTSGE